jgi:hypothetical protein
MLHGKRYMGMTIKTVEEKDDIEKVKNIPQE